MDGQTFVQPLSQFYFDIRGLNHITLDARQLCCTRRDLGIESYPLIAEDEARQ